MRMRFSYWMARAIGAALLLVGALAFEAMPAQANKIATPPPPCGTVFTVVNHGHHTAVSIFAIARVAMQTGATSGRTGGFADAMMPNLLGTSALKPGGSVHPLSGDHRPDNPQVFTLMVHFDDGHETTQDVNICAGNLTLSY